MVRASVPPSGRETIGSMPRRIPVWAFRPTGHGWWRAPRNHSHSLTMSERPARATTSHPPIHPSIHPFIHSLTLPPSSICQPPHNLTLPQRSSTLPVCPLLEGHNSKAIAFIRIHSLDFTTTSSSSSSSPSCAVGTISTPFRFTLCYQKISLTNLSSSLSLGRPSKTPPSLPPNCLYATLFLHLTAFEHHSTIPNFGFCFGSFFSQTIA